MNRKQRRELERAVQGGIPLSVVKGGKEDAEAEGIQKQAEELLAAAVEAPPSSPGTTLSVLAHQWFTLAQQQEASRMTQDRFLRLQKMGKAAAQRDGVAQQYAATTLELEVIEDQIVDLLKYIVELDGVETAIGILGAPHMNMVSDVTVRIPVQKQAAFLIRAGITSIPEEPEGEPTPPA